MLKKKYKWLFAIAGVAILLSLSFVSGILGAITYTSIKSFTSTEDSSKTPVVMSEVEKNVIDVVDSATESVVSIAVSSISFQPGEGIVDSSSNIGTGFVVDKNGLIITNQHVVSANSDYRVVTSEGTEYEVLEIHRDDTNDIALLKVDADDLIPLELGDSSELVVGQSVIAIGTPLGSYAGSVTTGVISGLDRSVSTGNSEFWGTSKEYEDVIQTDAAVNPGNSGGPLLDSRGKVVGVNFATTSGADNISFALPIDRAKSRIEEFRKYGKFLTPYLGVEYQMISESTAYYYDDVVAGALVVRVSLDSPASKGGVIKGDIITEINGEEVKKSFVALIQENKIGEEIELKVWRDGKEVSLKVTLEEAG
jgi:serine protease Do